MKFNNVVAVGAGFLLGVVFMLLVTSLPAIPIQTTTSDKEMDNLLLTMPLTNAQRHYLKECCPTPETRRVEVIRFKMQNLVNLPKWPSRMEEGLQEIATRHKKEIDQFIQ